MRFVTAYLTQGDIGFLENELLAMSVPYTLFEILPDNGVAFVIDDGATQQQIDWAQALADNMQSLAINMKDEFGNPIVSIPNDGVTKMVVTCDELPIEFGFVITSNRYNDLIIEDVVDTDGILEITSNEIGVHFLKVYSLVDESIVNYTRFRVTS